VDRASHDRFDMAVLDITMPRKDGIEACTELCRMHPQLPVILITGYEHRPEYAQKAGARAVLRKPLDIGQFLGLVGRFSESA
jgi:CheY-like chemotaxis protein